MHSQLTGWKVEGVENLGLTALELEEMLHRYTVQLPPPSKSTIFEPQEGPREILMELDLGDPARSSSATGFGRDLLEAVERVLGLHYSPSYVMKVSASSSCLTRPSQGWSRHSRSGALPSLEE